MIGSQWQLGLLVGLLTVHALVIYYTYRLRKKGTTAGTVTADTTTNVVDVEDATVKCLECGTDNELGYRYCRSCVTRLPTTMDFGQHAESSLGRLTR